MRLQRSLAALLCLLLAGLASAQQSGDITYSASNTVQEGTRFIVRLEDTLDTKNVKAGKKFEAKLVEDLVAQDGSTIPRGKKLKGHVTSVDKGFRGRLLLAFDEIETRKGWVPLVATVVGVPGDRGVEQVGPEGEIERKGTGRRRMVEAAAIGAGVGAAAGAVTAGMKGAVIGAVAGAGVGLGTSLLTGRDLKLEDGQQLELRLDRPLAIPRR